MEKANIAAFELQPFPSSIAPMIQIAGTVARSRDQLILTYQVTGAIDALLIPSAKPDPERQWELWEATCFEAFIGLPDRPNYWEVNLSSNGDWNVFALQDYRGGLTIENRIDALEIQTERDNHRFQLTTQIPLGLIELDQIPLAMGITTVIQTETGELSYWAIAHCGAEADFHLRESFVLALEP